MAHYPPPRPPPPPSLSRVSASPAPAPPYMATHQQHSTATPPPPTDSPSTINDALSAEFPSISTLSKEDLQDLLSDPQFFTATFETLPQVRNIYQAQSNLIAANEALALHNLSLRSRLESLRLETSQAFSDAQTSISHFHELDTLQSELLQKFSRRSSYSKLLTAQYEADRHSEQIASEFVDIGSIDDDEFVKSFRQERKLVHKRGIVLSKWNQVQWDQ